MKTSKEKIETNKNYNNYEEELREWIGSTSLYTDLCIRGGGGEVKDMGVRERGGGGGGRARKIRSYS